MPNLHPKQLKAALNKTWKIVRGDLVQVMKGKDLGKQGVIKKVLRDRNRVIVEGVALVKKHVKKTKDTPGHIITKESSIHYSNVSLVDPKTGEPTRVGYKYTESGQKMRVAKKSGTPIPKPAILKQKKPKKKIFGTDTASEDVLKMTLHENEITDLKNQYLKEYETELYAKLRTEFEQKEQEKLKVLMQQKQFYKDVYQRAKEIMQQKLASQKQ